MVRAFSIAMAAGLLAGCATSQVVPNAARAERAPTGKLRAGMNLGNELFTTRDATTGELRGVAVDLMRELASRLGVPLEMVVHATPGEVADAAVKGTWDVAILAIAQARAQTITFSPPITEIEATYAVNKDSALKSASQVDASGVRIAATEKAGFELYLTQTLRHGTLIRTKGYDASMGLLKDKRVDAVAGLRPSLLEIMEKTPGARLLDDRFMTVNHGLSTPRERRAAAEYVKTFVDEMNASGFVARSIARNGVKGLSAVK